MALRTSAGSSGPEGSRAVGVEIAKSRVLARAQGACQPNVLPVDFYSRQVVEVARDLIGCIVEHRGASGRIVETEAYHESEPACHAFVGVTPRTRTLFGEPGIAYVYRSYGIHAMLNAVCEPVGVGAAVLIRALEPLDGIEEMRVRRGRTRGPGNDLAVRDSDLCSGPGKLTQALGIDLSMNASSLRTGPVVIRGRQDSGDLVSGDGVRSTRPVDAQVTVIASPRVGITKAVELRWRFCVAENPHVSRPRPAITPA